MSSRILVDELVGKTSAGKVIIPDRPHLHRGVTSGTDDANLQFGSARNQRTVGFTLSESDSRITVPHTGIYLIHLSVMDQDSEVVTNDGIQLRVNGTAEVSSYQSKTSTTNGTRYQINIALHLTANDYVEFLAFTDIYTNSERHSFLSMVYLG